VLASSVTIGPLARQRRLATSTYISHDVVFQARRETDQILLRDTPGLASYE